MRVGCGGCGGDSSSLDGMTAQEIIDAACVECGGGGGVAVHSVTLTSSDQVIDLADYEPTGGSGAAVLLVTQDPTGYWVPWFTYTLGSIVSSNGTDGIHLAAYRPGGTTRFDLAYDGAGSAYVTTTPWDTASIHTPPVPGGGFLAGYDLLYHDEFDGAALNAEWEEVAAASSTYEAAVAGGAYLVQNTAGSGTDPWMVLAPADFTPGDYAVVVVDVGFSIAGEFQGFPWVAAVVANGASGAPTTVSFTAAQVASSGDRLVPFRGNMVPPSTLSSTAASGGALVAARGFAQQIAWVPGSPTAAPGWGELGGGSTDYGLGSWTSTVEEFTRFGFMFVNDGGDCTFRVEYVRVYGASGR